VLDLCFRGARVVDGAGNPWYRADVGVRGDRIAHVGRIASIVSAAVREVATELGELATEVLEMRDAAGRAAADSAAEDALGAED